MINSYGIDERAPHTEYCAIIVPATFTAYAKIHHEMIYFVSMRHILCDGFCLMMIIIKSRRHYCHYHMTRTRTLLNTCLNICILSCKLSMIHSHICITSMWVFIYTVYIEQNTHSNDVHPVCLWVILMHIKTMHITKNKSTIFDCGELVSWLNN